MDREAASGAQEALKVKLDLLEAKNEGAQVSYGVVVGQRVSLGNPSSMSSAGGSKKKRRAVMRKESGDTREDESCQQNDVDVGMETRPRRS